MDAISDDAKLAFPFLKLVCDEIIKCPSKHHPEQFLHVISQFEDHVIEQLFDYILFPIKCQVYNNQSHPKRDTILCSVLDCLFHLICRTKFTSNQQFFNIYNIICYAFLKGNEPEKFKTSSSEELKLVGVKCVRRLLLNTSHDALLSLYSDEQCFSRLSVIIYNSLQFASNEQSVQLRVESLECLLCVLQLHDGASKDVRLRTCLRRLLVKCLPGILIECKKVVSQGTTQNHAITALGVKVWGRSVSEVVSGCERPASGLQAMVLRVQSPPVAPSPSSQPPAEPLSWAWLVSMCRTLATASQPFLSLNVHPHTSVRLALASCLHRILSASPPEDSEWVDCLLECGLVLAEDEDEKVAGQASSAVRLVLASMPRNLHQAFATLLKRLPRLLHSTTDDRRKEREVRLVGGYLGALGRTGLEEFVSCQPHLDRMVSCLVEISSLDTSSISLLEEAAIRDVSEQGGGGDSWKRLSVCGGSVGLESGRAALLERLAQAAPLHLLLALVGAVGASDPSRAAPLILTINHLVSHSPQLRDDEYSEVVKSIFSEYMEPERWNLPLTVDKQNNLSRAEAKSNVLQVCLVVEGLGILAETVGAERFAPYLFRCLYPLLESAASPLWALSSAGLESVRRVAKAFGRKGIAGLVRSNIDYLSHHVTTGLRSSKRAPSALSVLALIVRHADLFSLPSLLEIVNNVLVQSCDKFQQNNIESYLQVFSSYVQCILEWAPVPAGSAAKDETQPERCESLLERLLQYQQCLKDAELSNLYQEESPSEELSTVADDELSKAEESTDKEPELPDHIKLTVSIMDRASNFLPSKEVNRQILAMQVVSRCAEVLSAYEDELLPMAHKVWGPLVGRLTPGSHPLVIRYGFQLLGTLAATSTTFLTSRTSKEVLPGLCRLLSDWSVESKLKGEGHAYLLSQVYRTQKALVQGLGPLCSSLQLSGPAVLAPLLQATTPYLSALQPAPLQEACLDLYKILSRTNYEVVWLHLMSLWPQHGELQPVAPWQACHQMADVPENKPFAANVELLLSFLRDARN